MKKTLLHILMHNGRLLERALEEELAPHGLHHGQGRILLNIKSAGEITQADLARRMDQGPTESNDLGLDVEFRVGSAKSRHQPREVGAEWNQ